MVQGTAVTSCAPDPIDRFTVAQSLRLASRPLPTNQDDPLDPEVPRQQAGPRGGGMDLDQLLRNARPTVGATPTTPEFTAVRR